MRSHRPRRRNERRQPARPEASTQALCLAPVTPPAAPKPEQPSQPLPVLSLAPGARTERTELAGAGLRERALGAAADWQERTASRAAGQTTPKAAMLGKLLQLRLGLIVATTEDAVSLDGLTFTAARRPCATMGGFGERWELLLVDVCEACGRVVRQETITTLRDLGETLRDWQPRGYCPRGCEAAVGRAATG